jgi:hypothetical protein
MSQCGWARSTIIARLCGNRLKFRYRGVLHEFIHGPAGHSSGTQPVSIIKREAGARSEILINTAKMPGYWNRPCKLRKIRFAFPLPLHGAELEGLQRSRKALTPTFIAPGSLLGRRGVHQPLLRRS